MNRALVISGQCRFVKEGYESLKKNLYAFEDYKVFIHTWAGPLNEDCEIYNPESIKVEESCQVIPAYVLDRSPPIQTHYSMFYSMKEAIKLKQEYERINKATFDVVIRTRFDIELDTQLSVDNLYADRGVYSPDVCGNPAVISDWFNFSTSKNIDYFAEIYDAIDSYRLQGVMITSGEELITHMLRTKGLDIIKIPCILYLLRDRTIHKQLSNYWKYAK